jgi:hypothetical protein
MRIDAALDGEPITPTLETLWLPVESFGIDRFQGKVKANLLMMKGLPSKGILSVETQFVGSVMGNNISLFTLILIIAYFIITKYKTRSK